MLADAFWKHICPVEGMELAADVKLPAPVFEQAQSGSSNRYWGTGAGGGFLLIFFSRISGEIA